MSFGFSPSDILTGIQACRWIWTNCFEKNNSADERYKQFGNDVKLLETRLLQLKTAFENALNRYEQPDLDARDLRCDLKDVVGDFQQTIDQCVELLTKNVNLRRSRAGFVENVVWAASSQEKVDALARRIQFHTQKIYLVMEPVTLGLLTTIDGKVDEILELMRTHFAIESPLPELPSWLDFRLQETLRENPPTIFIDGAYIPLKEGFDALYSHFRESTYAFRDPETAEQTAEQYLNLLKSQWILEAIRGGEPFKKCRPGSLYPRTMAQLEQRIKNQHRRKDIVRFSDNQLQNLNYTAFLIWPPEETIQNKYMTDPNIGEEEILKLSIPNYSGVIGKDNLVVFRTGPTTLRIVRSVIGDRSGTPYYESERFNIHIDRFIPFYAIQDNSIGSGRRRDSGTMFSVGIYRGNETGETAYDIKEDRDMLNFQRAVTGYQVVFDNNVTWAVNHAPKLSRGRGKVQIWHYKPLIHEQSDLRESIPSSSSMDSQESQMTTTSAAVEKVLKGRDLSRISIHTTPTQNDATIGASTPPLPVIMIYSQERGEYSYFHIECYFGLYINDKACDCSNEQKRCKRIVIEKRKSRGSEIPFQVRKMQQNLSAWNLSIFSQPRHPMFENRKIVQSIDCKFLNLDFDTMEDRIEFATKFKKALQLRDKAENEFRAIINRTSFLSEKPGEPKRDSMLSKIIKSRSKNLPKNEDSSNKRLSGQTLTRTPTVVAELSADSPHPPKLRPISTFSRFSISEATNNIFGS